MNNRLPNPDAALDAILADPDVPALRQVRDESLALLLAGARSRRRQHRIRKAAGVALLSLLAVGPLWWSFLRPSHEAGPVVPSAEAAASVSLVHTSPLSGPAYVHGSTPPVIVESTTRGLERIATLVGGPELEQVNGDSALLAAVPGSVGFIGSGPDRMLVRSPSRSGDTVAGP